MIQVIDNLIKTFVKKSANNCLHLLYIGYNRTID